MRSTGLTQIAGGDPLPPTGLRARHRGQPARAHPSGNDPCRRAARTDPTARLADALRRRRQPRPTLVLPGLVSPHGRGRHRRRYHYLLIRRNDTTGELAYLRCYIATFGHRCTRWSPWPASAGVSRNPSKPPKASPGSISTKSGAGTHGTAGPPSPCSPTPSGRGLRCRTRNHIHPTGLIALTVNEFRRLFDALLLATNHTIATPDGLVTMATTTPIPSPTIPLPKTVENQ